MTATTPVRTDVRGDVRADRITGVFLTALGIAVTAGAVLMDRLPERGVDPWTVPGMVPGVLGATLAVLGLALALRRGVRRPPPAAADAAAPDGDRLRVPLVLGLCLVYAVGLVGRLPFWLATALFVFTFTAVLERDPADPPAARRRKLFAAAVLAAATGAGIHLLFQDLFLVRMP
ncbi:tripartite tricarboxylate transporter TctB family protein [Azospirillum halopraeferens]|uniref:tripartite tricarboxylate transporter TctB family protein n=1 Tax=Azospirillum halopraeferens TaxID=34010 RepID=UPI00041EE3A3|nr:tripartite tricarboxylate transporter TctB family protein [Azospirillum halopraeferens]